MKHDSPASSELRLTASRGICLDEALTVVLGSSFPSRCQVTGTAGLSGMWPGGDKMQRARGQQAMKDVVLAGGPS